MSHGFVDPEVSVLLDRAHAYYRHVYTEMGCPPERFIVTNEEYRLLQIYCDDRYITQLPNTEMRVFGMRVCRLERMAWFRDNQYMEHFQQSPLTSRPIQKGYPLPYCILAQLQLCRTERPATPQREVRCPCGEVIWDMSTCSWPEVREDEGTNLQRFNQGVTGGWIKFSEARAAMGLQTTPIEQVLDHNLLRPLDDPPDLDLSTSRRTFEERVCGALGFPAEVIGFRNPLPTLHLIMTDVERAFANVGLGYDHDPLPPLDDLDEGSQCCGQHFDTFAAYMDHVRTHGVG